MSTGTSVRTCLPRRGITVLVILAIAIVPAAAQAPQKAPAPAPAAAKSPTAGGTSFWKTLESYLQNTFQNIGALGEGRTAPGRIFAADLDGLALRSPARAVSSAIDLSWPVGMPDGTVFALRNQQVVRLRPGQALANVGPQAQWVKLLGVAEDGTVLGFVADPPFHRPASLTREGKLIVGERARTAADAERHGILLQQSRAYADGTRLRVIRSKPGSRGMDILIERPGVGSTNVSNCGNAECGQPSMVPGAGRVLFVR